MKYGPVCARMPPVESRGPRETPPWDSRGPVRYPRGMPWPPWKPPWISRMGPWSRGTSGVAEKDSMKSSRTCIKSFRI